MFIINTLKKLSKSNRTLFTTPTHLRGGIIPTKNIIGEVAFNNDFSEIDGLDNLKHPQNCILKSQNKAAMIYKTKATFYLTNGSSSGILASMLTVLNSSDNVLVARNVHESIFNGLVLTGAKPLWFLPDYDNKFDIAKGISLEKIEQEYSKYKNIKALIITSPTYEGNVSDIDKIADFCHKKNIILIVDEAHGALFPFSEKLPISAVHLGADICVQSLHKTAPSLTGTALLHIGKNSRINPEDIQKNLNLITTTSPSWLQIASIEGCIKFLNSTKGKNAINKLLQNVKKIKENVNNFEFYNNDDTTKILISHIGLSGKEISKYLDKCNIEDELVTSKAVLCLCGIGTTSKKLKKLENALNKFKAKQLCTLPKDNINALPKMQLSPREAFYAQSELIDKNNSVGMIIAENITPYPPCVPILMAGEIIEIRHLKYLGKFVNVIKC